MIHTYSFFDPCEAHDIMCERLMFGEEPGIDYDWVHGTEVGLHNVVIDCETIDFDYDLKKLWVPPSRWTMMVRQYIDPTALDDCLDKIEERMSGAYGGRKARGIAVLRTRNVQGKGTGRNVRRRWGSCMLSLSFRATPVPTVTLHSRTTYFGYLALVDAAVARTFAAECAEITGIGLRDIQFVWMLELAQFHGFRSLAWVLSQPSLRKELEDMMPRRTELSPRIAPGNAPGYRKALDGYARILKSDEAGVLYGDEAFSSFCRVRRRFHTEVHGIEYARQFEGGSRNRGGAFEPLPSTMVSTLDFTPLDGREGEWNGEDDDDE
jgi:hypothetical protein